jgi:hypothetical protein
MRIKNSAAIMQPYFLPYIGYWQLINSVDHFVVYDRIKYTKKGWINRNRFLQNNKDAVFTLPLRSTPDHSLIVERELASDFDPLKLVRQLQENYRHAPYFSEHFPHLKDILLEPERNLFRYILQTIQKICRFLDMQTKILISSDLGDFESFKGSDKVLAICKSLGAQNYVNPIGGTELYQYSDFSDQGIELSFLKTHFPPYPQFGADFVPWLSIVDVLMFLSKKDICAHLNDFELVQRQ